MMTNKEIIDAEKYYDEETYEVVSLDELLGMEDDEDSDELETYYENYSNWIEAKGNYTPAIEVQVVKKMKTGIYKLGIINDQVTCIPQKISSDGLCLLPDSTSDLILRETEKFWKKAADFKKFNMVHKRGILLEGSPGTGRRL